MRLPSPARGSWDPCPLGYPQNQRPVFSPLSMLGWLPYSAPWNPGPHNTWALSRQVSETLIPVFLWFLIPPATMVSAGPLPCHVPSKSPKNLASCPAQPAEGGGSVTGGTTEPMMYPCHCHFSGCTPSWQWLLGCLPVWLSSS